MTNIIVRIKKKEFDRMKEVEYKYRSYSLLLKYIYEPITIFLFKLLISERITPNMITATHFSISLLTQLFCIFYFASLSTEKVPYFSPIIPCTISLLGGFLWFLLDNMDGKQARKTKTCSLHGDLLDHGVDCFVASLVIISAFFILRGPFKIISIPLLSFVQVSFVKTHVISLYTKEIVEGYFDATEGFTIWLLLTILSLFWLDRNGELSSSVSNCFGKNTNTIFWAIGVIFIILGVAIKVYLFWLLELSKRKMKGTRKNPLIVFYLFSVLDLLRIGYFLFDMNVFFTSSGAFWLLGFQFVFAHSVIIILIVKKSEPKHANLLQKNICLIIQTLSFLLSGAFLHYPIVVGVLLLINGGFMSAQIIVFLKQFLTFEKRGFFFSSVQETKA